MSLGQVIVVNGTSGAGKTTTITNYAKRSDESYLMFGIDQLMGQLLPVKFSGYGDRAEEGMHFVPVDPDDPESPLEAKIGDVLWQAFAAFHDMIAAASKAGQNVILDHIMFVDPPILQDCIWRLKDVPVTFVSVQPPKDVLFQRLETRTLELPEQYAEEMGETAREDLAKGMQRMIPWFYEAAYKNDCYDLVIDSSKFNPDEVCEQIAQRVAAGPGTAFETLRGRYAQG